MFADPLCEGPWGVPSRRGWTTLASFAVQSLGVGLLLLLPLIYTEGLPGVQLLGHLVAPAPPPGPPAVEQHQSGRRRVQSNLSDDRVTTPDRIPVRVAEIVETAPPPPLGADELSVVGSTGSRGARNGVLNSVLTSLDAAAPLPPPKPVAKPPRISRMMEGNLIYRVQPEYPMAAKAARIQGPVVLRAVISKKGTIENLTVVSGHPMLVRAAIEAVSKWRYRPYLLNGDPFEVETQVTVNFILN